MKIKFRGRLIDECIGRAVIKVDGIYHLFEECVTLPIFWTIRKRTSRDGFVFSEPSDSLIKNPDDYDARGQADPSVIYDGQWKMWFDCLRSHTPDIWDSIAYATSKDGETWEKQKEVLWLGKDFDSAFIHHPCVVKWENKYFMFYAGSDNTCYRNMQIGLALSDNGIDFKRYSRNPVIKTSLKDWDCVNVRPSVPVLVNDLWYMFYWGFDGILRAIGLATSPDLVNWTKKGKLIGEYEVLGITNPTSAMVIYEEGKFKIWFADYTGNLGHVSHSALYFCTYE